MKSLEIREIQDDDHDAVWEIFQNIVSKGQTYAYDPDSTRQEALRIWVELPTKTYVALVEQRVVGTYYLKPNQPGLGSHVCNCGYMVADDARGKGIASALCEHSQLQALSLGFLAMQFNLVVSTNIQAVRLWNRLGFETVGRLPKAYRLKNQKFVDALVMYKWLERESCKA